jgi:RimJ/RimL family protein N-acetyltransferase
MVSNGLSAWASRTCSARAGRCCTSLGAAPDDLVAAFANARNAIGDAPTGGSAHVKPRWTVERVREAEAEVQAAGDESRFVVAIHEETGAVAALTGMVVDPGRLELCWQRDTAVVEAHRGLGLGRATKAAMMRWVLTDHPGLERVITNTAAENAHMIRVNKQLGYSHYADIGLFEGSIDDVGAALKTALETAPEASSAIPGPRRESASEGEPVG